MELSLSGSRSRLETLVEGLDRPLPPRFENGAQVAPAGEPLARSVGRAAVHDNDLAGVGHVLSDLVDATRQPLDAVECRDDDRDNTACVRNVDCRMMNVDCQVHCFIFDISHSTIDNSR